MCERLWSVDRLREWIASRDGYSLRWAPGKEDFATAYVVSHKGRIVGAVCFYPGGDSLSASSILEAQDWARADGVLAPVGWESV